MGNKIFSSHHPPSPSNSVDPAGGGGGGGGMDRWTGVLHVPLSRGGPLFRVAASLILLSAKTLAVPRANAVLFMGDRVRGTGDPVIERLSDAAHLAGVLAGKLSGDTNAWVIDAPCFAGPFAVYRLLVPSVDAAGDPKGYDPNGFPAAAGIASILVHGIGEIQNKISGCSLKDSPVNQHPAASLSSYCPPRTIILGFSKGGVVVNQLVTELSCWASKPMKSSVDVSRPDPSHVTHSLLVPTSTSDVLSSISEFHYVDVGLNCAGAYITDHTVIKELGHYVLHTSRNLHFVLHGTPRQWSDPNRLWIRKEKDIMTQLLRDETQRCEGRLMASEKKYFDSRPCSLRMHFEILEAMDIS
ncbi:uncharacterized protein LOC133921630 isoform X2 [Phragmites australis]|uniref:uncharacterized protein LOC133921630 isoform X2 n=1 Tax=Phragmites australis TaxID=29695 RepID=UPI002D77558E|nr:uncharacterized protein LOC133921630 isoform X2 [Phragmites australis]